MNSFLVKVLILITDRESDKELHSEVVSVLFNECEQKWLRGTSRTRHDDHLDIEYWLRSNTVAIIDNPDRHDNIFRTTNQKEKLFELTKMIRSFKYTTHSVVLETLEGRPRTFQKELQTLKNSKENIIWLGEFV